jgi:hypothetical protein
MRNLCMILVVPMYLAVVSVAQEKPCIAFSSADSTETNIYARDPLASAVTLSGDFGFYSSQRSTCWNVHVLSAPVTMGGSAVGYGISYTVTDPSGVEVGHGLLIGHDTAVFDTAMRNAAADAVKSIRFMQSLAQPTKPTSAQKP